MDIELARTFLEIVNAGSFVRASERLNVSQTTVSARIRSLECLLGCTLFVRNKAGASLTSSGEQFLRYAPTLVHVWQHARHQVGIPANRRALITIGGELSLWNPLLINWLVRMKKAAPDVALRVEIGLSDDLMTRVGTGVLDIALMYRPQSLPGLRIERLLEEKLILVTTDDRARLDGSEYVYVDWGPFFSSRHGISFPDLTDPGLSVSLGPLGLSYILECGGSGYFRKRTAKPYLTSGQIHRVKSAPEFSYPVHVVYPSDGDKDLLDPALAVLREVAADEPEEWPIEARSQRTKPWTERSAARRLPASSVSRSKRPAASGKGNPSRRT
jgi:DNA-binding transcriptional LysR family regulator